MDDGMEEILRRLEALEKRVEELSSERGGCRHGECSFRTEERRIVDLVVRLTAERVEETLARMLAERSGPPSHGGPPPGGHGAPPWRR